MHNETYERNEMTRFTIHYILQREAPPKAYVPTCIANNHYIMVAKALSHKMPPICIIATRSGSFLNQKRRGHKNEVTSSI